MHMLPIPTIKLSCPSRQQQRTLVGETVGEMEGALAPIVASRGHAKALVNSLCCLHRNQQSTSPATSSHFWSELGGWQRQALYCCNDTSMQ